MGYYFTMNIAGLKIYDGLGEVAKSLTQLCKHLSIQLSENEGDIERYCKEIKIILIVMILISFLYWEETVQLTN